MKKIKLWGTASVGTKGQVVIPAKARDHLNIKEGDQLLVLSPPLKNGILLVKAEDLEKMLAAVQTEISDTLSNLNKPDKRK